ncbi:60S ribosomal export protein NMD3 [Methermicoccus shengliensis]|uniref:Nmd3 N-terminal domain-containing protein n=1 Tax=Methermicoccus shengliensis TaxID=660064 RepID=A0A832RYW7_9EURY|nr:60S ribosomal export protein NMD3 [Methermicoccus shengliensis]KUK04759.1 MAG: NMD protein affecting ribosome stability and mRNA decay [Euryarchaeota archaeon 55_53]KUK29919.1 MAG: NMD protein affecting ribosome stability and mRNA decay [Methanosarcinales archeaon 56_1174]MDI3487676.1 ribosomal export protein [Methanosarcinales archaeon]MDN5295560.1 ribosomal export protein [Methanosarcinales archaeon]HIH70319.1 hypothetical protein [Methermicoccus shengliensis]
MRPVCPRCGKETDLLENGMCAECRLRHASPVKVHTPETLRVCRGCGAVFEGRWVDVDDIEQVIRRRVLDSIEVAPEAKDVDIEMSLAQMSSNMYRVEGKVVANERNWPFVLHIRLAYESCPSCSRRSGGYFEAVVQVRSYARSPTEAELERVRHTVDVLFSRLREKGERLAFLTKEERVRGGIDLYVGSAKAAKKLCTEVLSQMGGTLTTSSTLAGRRDGRDVYRITYALRLPGLSAGDVVSYKGEPHVVVGVRDRVHLEPLYGRGSRHVPLDEPMDVLGKLSNVISTTVLEEDATALLVLHPSTLTPVWVRRVEGVHAGDELGVLVVGSELLAIPKRYL